MNIQDELEREMLDQTKLRQKDDNRKTSARGEWSASKIGTMYQHSMTRTFAAVVHERLTTFDPRKPGPKARAVKLISDTGLEPEVVAHLFIKSLLSTIPERKGKRLKRSSLCIMAGDLIHDELRIRHFAEVKERKNLLKKLFKQFDKRTYPREWRKRTIRNYFDSEQLDWSTWNDGDKQQVGIALLQWFRDSTGMVTFDEYVEPTLEFIEHIEQMMDKRLLDFTFYMPMVVKPRPWSMDNLFRGGYNDTKLVKAYPLVKRTGKKDVAGMLARDWSQIIPAINALQETGYRINKTVLTALQWAVNRGGGVAGLPLSSEKPLPPEPDSYRTDPEIKAAHNILCFAIHSENREAKSKRHGLFTAIRLAEKFKNFRALYFPHNLDNRGRAYPVPVILNPQGPDHVKALLEFSEGVAIEDEDQAAWLAIIVANSFGKDKLALQARADWTCDNEEMVLSVANDPTSDIRWTDADEPFQFLRACIEWRDFKVHGYGFLSHMVCPVDATCSGLQHYSAALRDEQGGRAVNLTNSGSRQDIYQDVADLTNEKLMNSQSTEFAKNLLGLGITRSDTKRQVMVVPYAGTFQSCMDYTRKSLKENHFDRGEPVPWGTLPDNATDDEKKAYQKLEREHVVMLATCIWDSINAVVIKGREAMTWLTGAARAYVKVANTLPGSAHERAMTWITPDGFLVSHCRVDVKQKRAQTYLDGKVLRLVYYGLTDKLSSEKMSQAVAPNWVHSLDACLLRMAVMRGIKLERPITSFCMIHDSFGVHAARMGEFLSRCVKPAFVDMYKSNDVLADLRDRLLLTPGLTLPPLPEKGTLDLEEVHKSEFFFS